MSDPSSKLAAKPTRAVPVARPALPGVAVVPPGEEDQQEYRSPWELTGWAWSIVAHSILLLILGLWYFGGRPSQVRTFDTRLAGSEHGVEDGLNQLGGLDTPVAMPELAPTPTSDSAL